MEIFATGLVGLVPLNCDQNKFNRCILNKLICV